MQSKIEWRKKILPLVLLLAAAAVILLYGRFSVTEEYAFQIYRASDSLFTDQLQEGETIETSFVADRDMTLSGVLLTFVNFGVADQPGTVLVEVVDRTTGKPLGSATWEAGSIMEWVWQEVDFTPAAVAAGDEIVVRLTANGFTDENALSAVKATDDDHLALKIRADRLDLVQKFQIVAAVLLLILITVVYLLLFVWNVRLEVVFLIAFSCMGMLFMLLIPAKLGADEDAHLNTVYKIAEQIEGWESSDPSRSVILHEELENALSVNDPSHPYYVSYYDYLRAGRTDESLAETEYWGNVENPKLTYFPAALGIVAGRHLGLSAPGIILMGRLFSFLVVLLLLFYAVRRIPFGKELFFTIAMLPTMLQESATINADGIDIALSFALTAAVLSRLYGEKDKERFVDYTILIVTALVLSRCKFGALLPFGLLPLVFFFRFLKKRKEGLSSLSQRERIEETILGIGGLVLPLICIIAGFLPLFSFTVNAYGGTIWTNHYQVSDLLRDPAGTAFLLGSTVYEKLDFYFFSLGGTSLGWMNILLPQFLILLGLFFVLLSSLPEKSEHGRMQGKEKAWFFVIALLTAAFAAGGMLIGWTEKGASSIEGVQGRYFLPALPLFLLALQNARISIEDGSAVRKKAVYAAVFLQVLVVTALFVRMQ